MHNALSPDPEPESPQALQLDNSLSDDSSSKLTPETPKKVLSFNDYSPIQTASPQPSSPSSSGFSGFSEFRGFNSHRRQSSADTQRSRATTPSASGFADAKAFYHQRRPSVDTQYTIVSSAPTAAFTGEGRPFQFGHRRHPSSDTYTDYTRVNTPLSFSRLGEGRPSFHKRYSSFDSQYGRSQTPSTIFEDDGLLPPELSGNTTKSKDENQQWDLWYMRLPFVLSLHIWLLSLGLAIAIAFRMSNTLGGFPIPNTSSWIGILSEISPQSIAAFIPAIMILPDLIVWRELDWEIRNHEPYITLSKGNATAEESILLNYINLGPVRAIPRALKYKHRLVAVSSALAALTYMAQPFAYSLLVIRQVGVTSQWTGLQLETMYRHPDVGNLTAFLSGASYADMGVSQGTPDSKYVKGPWAIPELRVKTDPLRNGTVTITTYGLSVKANCSNPVTQVLTAGGTSGSWTLSATSVNGCAHTTTFTRGSSPFQYGVEATSCPGLDGTVDPQVDFRPVLFWLLRDPAGSGSPEAKAVFCAPRLVGGELTVSSDVSTGDITNVEVESDIVPSNDVLNGPNGGRIYNGVVFSPTTDPLIQGRADAIRTLVMSSIVQNMTRARGGWDSAFASPNGVLDAVSQVYARHLTYSAKGVYFIPLDSSAPRIIFGVLHDWQPRLVLDPIPTYILSSILCLTGIAGIFVHVRHRNKRKRLRLFAVPGSVAAITALVYRSSFGQLLEPTDTDKNMEKKLDGLRFSIDHGTGCIIGEPADEDERMVPGWRKRIGVGWRRSNDKEKEMGSAYRDDVPQLGLAASQLRRSASSSKCAERIAEANRRGVRLSTATLSTLSEKDSFEL